MSIDARKPGITCICFTLVYENYFKSPILMLDHYDKMLKWFGFEAVDSAVRKTSFPQSDLLVWSWLPAASQNSETCRFYSLLVLQPVGFIYYRVISFFI